MRRQLRTRDSHLAAPGESISPGGVGVRRWARFPQPPIGAVFAALGAVSIATLNVAAVQTEKVVVVVVDGPRASEFLEDPTHTQCPRIWNDLRPQGYLSHAFTNEGWTLTIPGHATITTGSFQYLANDGSQRPTRPLLWEYLRDQTGANDHDAVLITNKEKLRILTWSSFPGYGPSDSCSAIGPTWSDRVTVQRFIEFAETHQPCISLLSLAEPDLRAHEGSWSGYLAALSQADSLAAAVWDWIQTTPGYADRTAFFLTADHGRHLTDWTGHGDGCAGCRQLPFLALGPDFVSGIESWSPAADQRDIAVTAAALLGLTTPWSTGRALWEIFQEPADVIASTDFPDGTEGARLEVRPNPARGSVHLLLKPMAVPGEAARWLRGKTLDGRSPAWIATLHDLHGRELWRGSIDPREAAQGWTLARPPGAAASGMTWLRLAPAAPSVDGGASAPVSACIVWIR